MQNTNDDCSSLEDKINEILTLKIDDLMLGIQKNIRLIVADIKIDLKTDIEKFLEQNYSNIALDFTDSFLQIFDKQSSAIVSRRSIKSFSKELTSFLGQND